ncbi:DUF2846 domain-containing protein [Bradyrhizobium sp. 199]|uniref:DUF2846 domain-containing protein n=1 Tax=Bradyrhizobium sp. 199 TaxID=2782664 RepID=UPI001FF8F918|nr:DUF2846 domain-containing protein [Bradyrhizobium sp. 199]
MLLQAASETSAFAQNQASDTRQGHIYFIRHSSVLSRLGKPDIKVDGKVVGELAVATYILVDRPAGPHTITVVGAMDSVGCEAEIRVQPGMSHYFEMGPIVNINMDTFNIASMGVTGRPVPCRNRHNTPYMFYSLDATAGAAAVARIKGR